MENRTRHIPSWLEHPVRKVPPRKKGKLTFVSPPRTVVYVMSPQELEEAATAFLEGETYTKDQAVAGSSTDQLEKAKELRLRSENAFGKD